MGQIKRLSLELCRPAPNTISAVWLDVYSYCMLSQSDSWSPSIRAAYCTWTRGDRFFCLLATPAYNVIHTTKLNDDTNPQDKQNKKDDHKTQIRDVDVEDMQRKKEEGGREKRSEGTV